MPHRIGANLGKYKHIIVIVVALAAVGSYFLPPNIFVFAAPNNANSAARDSILKGLSHSGSGSSSSTPQTSSTAKAAGSKPSADPGTGNTGTGNTGNLNSGNGNTGNLNSGNGNTGNHNSGSGFIGNNCGSGSGHYSCIKNGKIIRG